ncbi:MAG: prolyl oligopeptidase family serine peptidase [Dehalococcoidia bacterium]
MPEVAPYGSWKSPITADLIVSSTVGIGAPRLDGEDVYWLEGRPQERGRQVIIHRKPDGSTEELNPAPFNARTRVHEYGGGEYLVAGGNVYFSNFADQRIYRAVPGGEPQAVTHDEAMRYADAVLDAGRNRLVLVREDHSREGEEATNGIAAIDLATGAETLLVSGADFYSTPRVSPDGLQLAWLAWMHPNMPWDGTDLYVAHLDASGKPGTPRKVAGGVTESIFQPQWSPDGTLYFVSDRTGWWNIYRERNGSVEAVAPLDAEFGTPQWVFGMSTYAFATAQTIVAAYNRQGTWQLCTIDTTSGVIKDIETPFTSFGSIQARGDRVAFTAGSPSAFGVVALYDLAAGSLEVLKRSSELAVDEGYVSKPETIEFPTENGLTAFGFFYPPQNKDYVAPEGEKPPLFVMSHGGPTAATSATFSLRTQYWTSRGIAVLDVNYGGSSGYGRPYRERLNGTWGITDVDDCSNGALYLAEQGRVDGERLAITGGSAGGFTTLAALAFRDVFKLGTSHFGVADLESLALDTHKFESRYLDSLIGPYPERKDLYVERSPIHHVEGLNCPVAFFQGLEDKIVPPNQAETMVAALKDKGLPVAYLAFEGEQHGFRQAENIKRALEGEQYFLSRVFGYELADPVEPIQIDNL